MSEGGGWVGAAVPRKEDEALLTGHARFIDDMEPVPGLRHVALLRSPHPHAEIADIDVSRAAAHPGVHGVLTGADIAAATRPIPSAVRVPIDYYPMAVDKARHAGEPVALVAADDRYVAEDAVELIEVAYRPLPPVIDPKAAAEAGAALLHEAVGSNVVHRRSFRYGDPETAFAEADRIVRLDWTFPRYSSTPMETYGVIAAFEPAPDRYTVWSNFQGPFILHALMAGALGVPGNRLRLITSPQSGGSFGIKQGMFPHMVLLAAASRLLGAPLKWVEDRLEHLVASSSGSNRADEIEAAFRSDGTLTGLRFRNLVDVGAYIRAPEPASVYRMHSASNGAYRVRDIAIDNRLVTTNRLPIGLNRGYGGPQFFFALERAMDAGARALGIDIAEIRRRNFIPADAFPYTAPAGAVYDAGDYEAALDRTLELADYEALRAERDRARAAGRLFGIGLATAVEPSGSNMAYVTLAQTPEERARSGGRSGGLGTCTIAIDPSGSVTVKTVSTPAGQGHATVAAQVVADALGLTPDDIDVVTEVDTLTSAWSLASGNYANRFSSVVVDAIGDAARRVAEKIRLVAAEELEVAAEDVELAEGMARVLGVKEKALPFRRVAAKTHWHPAGLPEGVAPGVFETAVMSPPALGPPDAEDRVASAVTFGFICDLAAVEIDGGTGRIEVRKYVSVHDVGRVLNPLIAEGQIVGGFAHGIAGALMEEMVYDEDGNPLSGTFADYLCITAPEMPGLTIGHFDTPSPHTALGAKGWGTAARCWRPRRSPTRWPMRSDAKTSRRRLPSTSSGGSPPAAETPGEARALRILPGRHAGRGAGARRRVRRRRRGARRRDVARPHAQHAACAPCRGHRHQSRRRAVRHPGSGWRGRDRRALPPGGRARLRPGPRCRAPAGRGAALRRAFPDAQPRHARRVGLPRRSERGNPAGSGHARRRDRAAAQGPVADRPGEGFLRGHIRHRARARRDHRGARGQSVPLHRIRADRPRRAAGGRRAIRQRGGVN